MIINKNFLKLNFEKIIFILLGLSFFAGIWHALPMLSVINDEFSFVGGVLRAMENHSLLPQGKDVSYGTIFYFLNYILIGFVLLILLPFFKFNLFNLKLFLIKYSAGFYLIPRLLNVLLALGFLFLINKLLKKAIEDTKSRLFLLILLFTNIITALILHTGKMWVLGMFLVLVSFYYLYQALLHKEQKNQQTLLKNIFFSIIFSFLATANFALNFFSLVNIPLLIIFFRKRLPIIKKIIIYSLLGIIVFIGITLLNFNGTKDLFERIFLSAPLPGGEEVVSKNIGLIQSLALNIKKIIILFPLLLITLLWAVVHKIKNKSLFLSALIYFIAYLLVISMVARWPSNIQEYLRYLFPLGFFIALLIASFDFKFQKIFWLIGSISVVYFIFTIYYLSIPTTYNQAYDWSLLNLRSKDITIINNVAELDLPKNREAYLLNEPEHCGSKCQNVIKYDLNKWFGPLVIDRTSKPDAAAALDEKKTIYYFDDNLGREKDRELIRSFKNAVADEIYYSVDYNIGSYFDLDFFRINNFGKNIYIYKLTASPILP